MSKLIIILYALIPWQFSFSTPSWVKSQKLSDQVKCNRIYEANTAYDKMRSDIERDLEFIDKELMSKKDPEAISRTHLLGQWLKSVHQQIQIHLEATVSLIEMGILQKTKDPKLQTFCFKAFLDSQETAVRFGQLENRFLKIAHHALNI